MQIHLFKVMNINAKNDILTKNVNNFKWKILQVKHINYFRINLYYEKIILF